MDIEGYFLNGKCVCVCVCKFKKANICSILPIV